jgi:hypothetical protein
MAETLKKYEYGSPEWVAMVRGLVEDGLADEDLAGVNFSFCEENTDPPAHMRRPGSDTIGFYVRVENGEVEVGDHPIEGTTFKIVGDYTAMREYALRPFPGANPDPETAALRQRMIAEGKMRVVGVRAEWPAVISNLDLHNRARLRTA